MPGTPLSEIKEQADDQDGMTVGRKIRGRNEDLEELVENIEVIHGQGEDEIDSTETSDGSDGEFNNDEHNELEEEMDLYADDTDGLVNAMGHEDVIALVHI